MTTIEHKPVDRTGWQAGPWDGEPDRIEWEHAGLPCLLTRHDFSGHLCGYVAVLPGHPLHGVAYGEGDATSLDAHGGVNYSNKCTGKVCHVPKPGEPDDVWWFGFDCGHSCDLQPGLLARYGDHYPSLFERHNYRDVEYVTRSIEGLAEQLAAVRAIGPVSVDANGSEVQP